MCLGVHVRGAPDIAGAAFEVRSSTRKTKTNRYDMNYCTEIHAQYLVRKLQYIRDVSKQRRKEKDINCGFGGPSSEKAVYKCKKM